MKLLHRILLSPWLWRVHAATTVFMLLSLWAQWYVDAVQVATAFVAGFLVAQQMGRLK